MQRTPRHSVSTTSSNDSRSARSPSIFDATSPTSPFTTPPSSLITAKSNDAAGSLLFSPAVGVSFTKGTNLFKLKFTRIDVLKDATGALRRLEMSADAHKRESVFFVNFPNTRLPVPHLEQPYVPRAAAYRVSFLEEQTMQTGGNLFQAKPSFSFDRWEDCVRFQEALLGQQVVFVAGMAEAKSKGRGEECITQNLRVLRVRGTDRLTMVFFANSQRKEKRRYVSVPVASVDGVEAGKKGKVAIRLREEGEVLKAMKVLQVQFLEEGDAVRFLHFVKR
ncbi:uncharacterized protein HMPREF1541_10471 [Cyphellophora europaea CBS 101466]|uniref:Uncharacterized protein n=1 Tax=Cyphellophora europaea (strain CBS 101466) TaxID=1220924 RepID=W2S6G5_CYPE1|nr:uncharacterized protein HMPREF1541_10471 [Cyphellophora europaea CBS 101466]ETN44291.1 hypothetical protein HMPREF1541_10471 [Cyphellophora europaea CBS 101466]